MFVYQANTNAQISVSSNGNSTLAQHTVIGSYSTVMSGGDALDVINGASNLVQDNDIIWGYYSNSQSKTSPAGMLHMESVDGAQFCVNSLGNVGIGTKIPQYALDIPNGQIRASSWISPSDSTLKTNIKHFQGSLSLLNQLQGVTYNFKNNTISNTSTNTNIISSTTSTSSISNKSSLNIDSLKQHLNIPIHIDTSFFNKTHVGFLAQDVQKIYPQLVYKDNNGLLSLDYIGFIPILVEAVKTLSTQTGSDSLTILNLKNRIKSDSISNNKIIGQLEKRISTDSLYFINLITSLTTQLNQCCPAKTTKAVSSSDQIPISSSPNITQNIVQSEVATLAQNSPNPFSQNTTIGYYLPSNVVNAVIYIYNLQGVQIQAYTINGKGNGSVVISGNSLTAGMYIYTLITDGNVIDTKRMILTN